MERLFQNPPGKKFVLDLQKKIEAELFSYPTPETDSYAPQLGGIPSMRFDLFFEEPLHTFGVLG